jgi:5'-nucleotidase
LLTESEGGQAEEIVSEENGILISIMLRQYFMSLKVLRRWKHWGSHLGQHWGKVQEEVRPHCNIIEPTKPKPEILGTLRSAVKGNQSRQDSDDADSTGSESEDDGKSSAKVDLAAAGGQEKELAIKRKVMRKWWRLARLPGQPRVCDDLGEGEFAVSWTKVRT